MSLGVVVVVLTTTAIPGVGDSSEPPIVIPMYAGMGVIDPF